MRISTDSVIFALSLLRSHEGSGKYKYKDF